MTITNEMPQEPATIPPQVTSGPVLDVEYVHKQLKAIVTLLTLILVVMIGWFGYGFYEHSKIRHCATVEAESAPQQAACMATE